MVRSNLGRPPDDDASVALVRSPSPLLAECELTHLKRVTIDPKIATAQHNAYIASLQALGLEVRVVPALDPCPDGVFVEDTAVVVPEVAVLCRPGAASRIPEVDSVGRVLSEYRPIVRITEPGTLDGGDVLRIGSTLFVGRSSRSNEAGIQQLRDALDPFGYSVRGVEMEGGLHLKTGVSLVAPDTILLNPSWVDGAAFGVPNRIDVDPSEPMCANALWVRGVVILDAAGTATADRLRSAGIEVLPVDNGELGKAEGGVTCGSILLSTPSPDPR